MDDLDPTSNDPMDLARQYLRFRAGREQLQKNEDVLKKALMEMLSTQEDDQGHGYFRFSESLDGIEGFKRERRVSQILDEDLAMKMILTYGLEDTCLETITVINEDGLLAANFSGVIPDEAMQDLYIEKVSHAFVMMKEKR